LEDNLIETIELNKRLSVYKNQEYPEKLLKIENLKKKLNDTIELNKEENENINEILTKSRNVINEEKLEMTSQISNKITSKAIGEMHDSIKDMAHYNKSLRDEIQFYNYFKDKLKQEINERKKEINTLKMNEKRNLKDFVYSDIFTKNDKSM
jgi:hypothetical protein